MKQFPELFLSQSLRLGITLFSLHRSSSTFSSPNSLSISLTILTLNLSSNQQLKNNIILHFQQQSHEKDERRRRSSHIGFTAVVKGVKRMAGKQLEQRGDVRCGGEGYDFGIQGFVLVEPLFRLSFFQGFRSLPDLTNSSPFYICSLGFQLVFKGESFQYCFCYSETSCLFYAYNSKR